jgi:ATP-dependent helicase/nuclease subunit A
VIDRPSSPDSVLLPRELVLASAGTGKTFALSSRLIGLMALGAPPDTLLASTFTRKAAGEILARVLDRLAEASLDSDAAKALSEQIRLPGSPAPASSREFYSNLLRRLVRDLHRANVGTLDSLFIRIAGSFAGELGLPPDWSISDEPTAQRLESEALQEVLSRARPREMAELIRMTMRGESGRGVHQRLLGQLTELRALIHQQRLPDQDRLWEAPEPRPELRGDNPAAPPDWDRILSGLRAISIPQGATGKPDGNFQKAVDTGIDALEREAWGRFCTIGLGAKVLAGEDTFRKKPITDETRAVVLSALQAATQAIRESLGGQGRALRALVTGFDAALKKIQRREGSYRFHDITFLLAGSEPMTARSDLWYRLDQTAHHLLLDEFQDTSRPQWEALDPLTSELLSGHGEERSALVVADPKQSIYGWRGAEPSLAGAIGTRFALKRRTLDLSYRSSKAILEVVNQVFGHLPDNPIWQLRPGLRGAAEAWSQEFSDHHPAKDLPGYVSVEAGPRDPDSKGSDRPTLMAWVARRVGEIHQRAPNHTLGVLVRRNAAVARLTAGLRARGIEASEEGASSLTDSPAVSTCLAALRLSDHPGDSIARYQLSQSPLGPILGLPTHDDAPQAQRVALRLRRDLLGRGYGEILEGWIQELWEKAFVDDRDLARLSQLLELAHRWDARATLRPNDFVRFVQSESMEAPSDARVRVMTVHQAKGLEFDIVVLPELHLGLTKGQGLYRSVLPLRDPETGQVLRIFPSLKQDLRPLFPEMEKAGQQDREGELHDALGVAYVAMTRARHALHLFLEGDDPDEGPKLSFSFAGLIRGGLDLVDQPAAEGEFLFEAGDPAWAGLRPDSPHEFPVAKGPVSRTVRREKGTRAERPRSRFLPHRSPSSPEGAEGLSISQILSLAGGPGRRVGSIVHAWLEQLEWLDDWNPDPAVFLTIGQEVAPGLKAEESDSHLKTLQGWLASESINARLRLQAYPQDSLVLNEEAFAVKLDGILYQGRIDRLVLMKEGDGILGAEVLDYKTDRLAPGDGKALRETIESYRGQIDLYRRAVAALYHLPMEKVQGTLVFLALGHLETLSGP